MELRALLLSRDDEMVDVLRRTLADLGVGTEVYSSSEWATEDLARHKFDAVIIDCESVSGAKDVLKKLRSTPSNSSSLAFAIVGETTSLQEAFDLGANLALDKPITPERARSSFRAAYGLMMQERRRYFRHPIDVPVTISLDEKTDFPGVAVNISEGGMAVKLSKPLRTGALVKLNFSLPGMKGWMEVRTVVIWTDEMGHCGMRFDQPPLATRNRLNDWLLQQTYA